MFVMPENPPFKVYISQPWLWNYFTAFELERPALKTIENSKSCVFCVSRLVGWSVLWYVISCWVILCQVQSFSFIFCNYRSQVSIPI